MSDPLIELLDDVETYLDTTQGPVCKKPCDHESCNLLERIREALKEAGR